LARCVLAGRSSALPRSRSDRCRPEGGVAFGFLSFTPILFLSKTLYGVSHRFLLSAFPPPVLIPPSFLTVFPPHSSFGVGRGRDHERSDVGAVAARVGDERQLESPDHTVYRLLHVLHQFSFLRLSSSFFLLIPLLRHSPSIQNSLGGFTPFFSCSPFFLTVLILSIPHIFSSVRHRLSNPLFLLFPHLFFYPPKTSFFCFLYSFFSPRFFLLRIPSFLSSPLFLILSPTIVGFLFTNSHFFRTIDVISYSQPIHRLFNRC